MKQIISLFVCVLLLFSVCITSNADSQVCVVSDLNMTIDIPDHYEVYVGNIAVDEERVKQFGELGEKILATDSAGCSLEAYDVDALLEIAVTSVDSKLGDYNQFSDTTLLGLASAMESVAESVNGRIHSTSIYQGAQAKFVIYESEMPHELGTDGLDHIIQYNTVYADKTINITLHSYNGVPDAAVVDEFENIVKSVRFLSNPASPPEVEYTPSFVYTDEDTGASFTVPENWQQIPLTKERFLVKAKFASNLEGGLSIIYGSSDLWAVMTDDEKEGLSRSDVDNSIFSFSDIVELSGGGDTEVRKVTYGEKDYYETRGIQSGEAYGLTMSAKMLSLYHVENGFFYMFQFPGTEESTYYQDFMSLISSVKYPSANPSASSEAANGAVVPGASSVNNDPELPLGLKFGMSQEQVRQLIGMPDEMSDDPESELSDQYYQAYSKRPLGFDPGNKWADSSSWCSFVLFYDRETTEPELNDYVFGGYDTSCSDDHIDMLLDYIDFLDDKYGEHTIDERENAFDYSWEYNQYKIGFTVEFYDDGTFVFFEISCL